jgi:hypothetical protein
MIKSKLADYLLPSILFGCLTSVATLSAQTNPPADVLVIDVAMDAGTLVYSRPDVLATGVRRADTYVINGFVYGGFSIPSGDTTETFAPDPEGSIGTIVMNGIYVSDPASAVSRDVPMITTTHVLTLNNADGFVTQGLEGAFPQIRALLGGTGQYSGSIGQVTEELLGTNGTGGYNIRFTFQLVRLNPQDNSTTLTAQKQRAQSLKARSQRPKR